MNYIFPVIHNIDEFAEHIKDCSYIGSFVHSNDATVFCYVFNSKDSFRTNWERECRGITFRKDGSVAIRPLHKFFNLNEKEEYFIKNIDLNEIESFNNKMDGSMISTGTLDFKTVVAKSKKSFTSEVAVKAQKYIDSHEEYYRFCLDMALKNITPTFEYTSNSNRIVLSYEEESLTLLHLRDNITGKYLDINSNSDGFNIKIVSNLYSIDTKLVDVVKDLDKKEGIEGVVVNLKSGDKFKIKSPWYLNLHHSVTFVRYRDVARLVCEQSIDDFKSLIITGCYDVIDMNIIDSIENEIITWLSDTQYKTNLIVEEINSLFTNEDDTLDYPNIYKYVSTKYQEPTISFVINTIRGRNIDYLYYYKSNILKKRWNLDQIASSLISDR